MESNRKDRRLVQVTMSESEYQAIRRKAYEMELTVNKALLALALREVSK